MCYSLHLGGRNKESLGERSSYFHWAGRLDGPLVKLRCAVDFEMQLDLKAGHVKAVMYGRATGPAADSAGLHVFFQSDQHQIPAVRGREPPRQRRRWALHSACGGLPRHRQKDELRMAQGTGHMSVIDLGV